MFAFVATAAGGACGGEHASGDGAAGTGGAPDAGGPVTCENRVGTVAWTMAALVSQLSGTVAGKVSQGNGAEQITFVDTAGAEHRLDLNIGMRAPLATGEQVES